MVIVLLLPAKVRFKDGVIASVDECFWSVPADPQMEAGLNLNLLGLDGEVNQAIDPDPDFSMARLIAESLHGVVFDHEPYNAVRDRPGVCY